MQMGNKVTGEEREELQRADRCCGKNSITIFFSRRFSNDCHKENDGIFVNIVATFVTQIQQQQKNGNEKKKKKTFNPKLFISSFFSFSFSLTMENFSTTTTIPEPETFAFYWSFILYIIVVEKGREREEEEGVGELVGWLWD